MSTEPSGSLSHVAPDGTARMVDVSAKADSARMARATGQIAMQPSTLEAIARNTLKKGDVLGVARVAGIMAAKRTSDLIPLCHPLPLHDLALSFTLDAKLPGVRVEAVARTVGKTGVEMEALVAASVALLTIYDMAKAIDRGMTIGDISLAEKTGGAGGDYARLVGTGSAI
ncbi:MAG: Molybdenum cofactor biosynthesis bacterial-type [Gemmatimonadetes bacterium]|jgi:cyclic pyranopterin phosphate synthase|nr:Molybdenum cofactor biosynthesis bacterial-type [Gemmatimonadota bacterium]